MFTTKAKSLYPKFTMAEKKIADYLIVNHDEIGDITSHELAERLGIGQSTVMRFSKKMGYRMFGELVSDVRSTSEESSSEIDAGDSTFEILEKVGIKHRNIVDAVIKCNDCDELERAANLVDAAKTLVCYGYANSHVLVDYLSESLVELGKTSVSEVDLVQVKRRIQHLDPSSDVVIVVSKSGERAESISVAEFAASRMIPVIVISDASDNPLAKLSEVHLKVLEISDRSTPMASMGTDTGVIVIVDALVACLVQKNRKRYLRNYGNSLVAAFSERR